MDEIEEWEILFTKQAEKDSRKIASAGLGKQVTKILDVIKENPYATYPPYEKLSGDLQGYYSRRINIQHRLVYQILLEEKIIKVIRMWTHYES
ncbi:Txe/YoeB family addiction module toxin [Roseofilum sp. BLCC_M114]|uniref:Endoribonuclease YoeB n=1 Tax=Roseofilum capinflatum BLCC-M114 TaxID=3022440 RepID=A0ABT7B9Y0_9CYAN|nr:Txe/YoeB family addiction module toxin [Roseofilum capinflatum]MDJ1175974.1 Txe/YoeB family addiction module toxin [Roseofilum capinflatum BLCC-M114]